VTSSTSSNGPPPSAIVAATEGVDAGRVDGPEAAAGAAPFAAPADLDETVVDAEVMGTLLRHALSSNDRCGKNAPLMNV